MVKYSRGGRKKNEEEENIATRIAWLCVVLWGINRYQAFATVDLSTCEHVLIFILFFFKCKMLNFFLQIFLLRLLLFAKKTRIKEASHTKIWILLAWWRGKCAVDLIAEHNFIDVYMCDLIQEGSERNVQLRVKLWVVYFRWELRPEYDRCDFADANSIT